MHTNVHACATLTTNTLIEHTELCILRMKTYTPVSAYIHKYVSNLLESS